MSKPQPQLTHSNAPHMLTDLREQGADASIRHMEQHVDTRFKAALVSTESCSGEAGRDGSFCLEETSGIPPSAATPLPAAW